MLFVVCVEYLVWLMELRVWFLEEEASARRWAQENKDTLGMRTREAEALATSRSLRIVKRGPFRKGPLTLEWLAVLVEISVAIGDDPWPKQTITLEKQQRKRIYHFIVIRGPYILEEKLNDWVDSRHTIRRHYYSRPRSHFCLTKTTNRPGDFFYWIFTGNTLLEVPLITWLKTRTHNYTAPTWWLVNFLHSTNRMIG